MFNKEIGGYFGLEQFHKSTMFEYYPDLISLNTACNALVYIAKSRKIKKLYLPYYLCDSVSLKCEQEAIPYELYSIDENFQPVFDKVLLDGEYLYVVNCYGQLNNERLLRLKAKHKRIIVDNIHAFFQNPLDGIDTIYSCRKFFGVPDGAYLSTDCLLQEELPVDNSKDRTKHIFGRIKESASEHYAEFKLNEELLFHLPLMTMSELTHNMLADIDYERIKAVREENFSFLHEQFRCINKMNVYTPDGPYAYPLYCKNGMTIKKKLAESKIYVATLWPNVLELNDSLEKDYSENILPLPCDQRYGKEEMKKLVEEVFKCIY